MSNKYSVITLIIIVGCISFGLSYYITPYMSFNNDKEIPIFIDSIKYNMSMEQVAKIIATKNSSTIKKYKTINGKVYKQEGFSSVEKYYYFRNNGLKCVLHIRPYHLLELTLEKLNNIYGPPDVKKDNETVFYLYSDGEEHKCVLNIKNEKIRIIKMWNGNVKELMNN